MAHKNAPVPGHAEGRPRSAAGADQRGLCRARWWTVPAVLAAAGFLSPGCTRKGGDSAPAKIERVDPDHGYNTETVRLLIKGSGLLDALAPRQTEKGKKARVSLEMWQGTASRLRKGFSLENARAVSDTAAEAVVPVGVDPGRYRLVLRSGLSMRFTGLAYTVLGRNGNVGPPRILRLEPASVRSDVPSRLTILGQNLHGAFKVELVGPLPERAADERLKRQVMRYMPFKGAQAHALLRVKVRNGARIAATIPPGLPAGAYAVKIRTETHRGHQPDLDHLVRVRPAPAGLSVATVDFLIYWGVMGFIFVVGMVLAWRGRYVGFKDSEQRRNLAWMLGGIAFYLVLLGLLQFVFSRWY